MSFRHPCDAGVVAGAPATRTSHALSVGTWVLIGTILGSSMVFIDGTVVGVALPVIQTELHADAFSIQWVSNAYALFLAALILVGGSLGDQFGRRRVFMIGTVIFTLASVACGLATNIGELIAARSVQGIGSALLTPGSLSIISATFDVKRRGRAVGIWSAATATTAVFGPVLGGWLVQFASWRWIFFINVPFAIAVLAISALCIPESRDEAEQGQPVDYAGAVLATVALGATTYGLIEAGALGLGSPIVIVSLVVGLLALVGFIAVEARSPMPMMPLSLFKSRPFSATNLLTLLLYGGMSGVLYFLPFDLIQVQHYSPVQAGFALVPIILIISSLSPFAGEIGSRYGPRVPLIVGPALASIGVALLAKPGIGGSYWTTFFPGLVVFGLGMATTVAPLTTTVLDSVDDQHVGLASGINNAVSRAAGLLAIAILSLVVVSVFGMKLEYHLTTMHAPAPVVSAMMAQKDKLADDRPPADAPTAMRPALSLAVAESYVSAFRVAVIIAALMALASALVTAVMIPRRKPTG